MRISWWERNEEIVTKYENKREKESRTEKEEASDRHQRHQIGMTYTSKDLSFNKHSETFVQPKVLPRDVRNQISGPTVSDFMRNNSGVGLVSTLLG